MKNYDFNRSEIALKQMACLYECGTVFTAT